MKIWRALREELAGAWRSLRYDLGRQQAVAAGPDEGVAPVFEEYERPPRRLLAASAFGVLALAGAAGSYFAVVNGLGALLGVHTPAPGPLPVVAEQSRQTPSDTPAGTVAPPGRAPAPALPPAAGAGQPAAPAGGPPGAAAPGTTGAAPAAPGTGGPATGVAPPQPGPPVPAPGCGPCPPPPVPTPASPEPEPSEPSPSPTPSPAVTESPDPQPSASVEATTGGY